MAHPLAGVVALGYPLHPPGNPAKQLRVAHLPRITSPAALRAGHARHFGGADELAPHLAPLGARVTVHRVEGGDHSFKVTGLPRGSQPQVLEDILDVVAGWVRSIAPGSG